MSTSSSKGIPLQKNFMAPTISASSKAVGPACQRKRVLGERNETAKSSHTLDQAEEIAGPAVRFLLVSTQVEETTDCSCKSSLSSPQIKDTASLSELSQANRASPLVGSETATQPDLLQSAPLPPYDPKVNYLSPRPRFLHYKPKPRGDLFGNELDFLGNNSDPRSLEDSSSSDCSDDATSAQTEEEDNLSKEATSPEIECRKTKSQSGRVSVMRAKLKIRHVFLVLLISCIGLPLSDSPIMIASSSNPNVPPVRFVGFHTTLLEVSDKLNGWLSECFSYTFAREGSFPRELNTFPMSNLTCAMKDKSSIDDVAGIHPSFSPEYTTEVATEENETNVSFDMVHRENEVSEIQIRYESGKLEEEEEKEIEADVGSTSEQQETAASSTISEMKEDSTQPEIFEKSEPEELKNPEPKLVEKHEVKDLKPKNPEPKLVENHKVKDPEAIMSENLEPELIEPESVNMSDEELINFSKKAAQGMASIAVLLSLVTAVAALAFAKRKQNWVLVSDSIRRDKMRPSLVQGSNESHVLNRIPLHQNSTLDIEEFSSSSFEVGTDTGIYTSTPYERKARRESEASSDSCGSYVSFEKISSKKVSIFNYEWCALVLVSTRVYNMFVWPVTVLFYIYQMEIKIEKIKKCQNQTKAQ